MPATTPALRRMQQHEFLKAYEELGILVHACKRARISTQTPYWWAERSEAFREAFEQTTRRARKTLEAKYRAELHQRCSLGKKKSDILLMFALKELSPSFRDNVQVNVASTGPVAITMQLDNGKQEPAIASKSES